MALCWRGSGRIYLVVRCVSCSAALSRPLSTALAQSHWVRCCSSCVQRTLQLQRRSTMYPHMRSQTILRSSLIRPSSPVGCRRWAAWTNFCHLFLSFTHSSNCGTSLPLWCRSSLTLSITIFFSVFSSFLFAILMLPMLLSAIRSYLSTLHALTIVARVSVSFVPVSPFDSNPVWCFHFSSCFFCLLQLVSSTILFLL